MVLFYLEEFSIKEIASTLEITTSSTAKRLERGRKQLRQHLENDWKSTLDADTLSDKKVTRNILSSLAIGPAMPLAAYAANGSLAAVPAVFPTTSTPLL